MLPVIQGPLRGKRWIVGSGLHGYWLGSYEYAKQRLFAATVVPGSVVYDIGANVGFYTLLAAARVGDQGRVIAFEPLPANIDFIHRHLQLNHMANAHVIGAAVGDCAGEAAFAPGRNRSTGTLSAAGDLRVKVVSIDEMVATGELPPADCMKIDVEGSELSVLRGARELLSHRHPVIFLATHGAQVQRECLGFHKSFGYECIPIDGRPLSESRELIAEVQAPATHAEETAGAA